jgi:hypothetical protein
VERKIKRKGIHVPRMLLNISKFFRTKNATRKKSTKMTKPRNMKAVCRGEV